MGSLPGMLVGVPVSILSPPAPGGIDELTVTQTVPAPGTNPSPPTIAVFPDTDTHVTVPLKVVEPDRLNVPVTLPAPSSAAVMSKLVEEPNCATEPSAVTFAGPPEEPPVAIVTLPVGRSGSPPIGGVVGQVGGQARDRAFDRDRIPEP